MELGKCSLALPVGVLNVTGSLGGWLPVLQLKLSDFRGHHHSAKKDGVTLV